MILLALREEIVPACPHPMHEGQEKLERDFAMQERIKSLVDHSHSAPPDLLKDMVL